jgi:outer membrane protein TolC
MRRVYLVLAALVLPALFLVGCQQHRFMTEADFKNSRILALSPVEDKPCYDEIGSGLDFKHLSTVVYPEGIRREMTLSECLAIALENGRTGELYDRGGSGAGLRAGALFAGRSNPSNNSDAIRVFSYDPAFQAAEIEQSLAKFDAFWQTTAVWNRVDQPRSSQAAFFRANSLQREQHQFSTELLKPLPFGGLAGITFRVDYDFSSINQSLIDQGSGVPNPTYTPVLEVNYEMPLLQGFGELINQIRDRHPGGIRNQVPGGGRVQGILLTRIAADQVQLEYENRIQFLCYEVEQAYWQLYCAYWDFFSRETAMRQAHLAWHIGKLKIESGKISGQEFAQIAQQFHAFRAQRIQALGNGTGRPGVLEAERRLRYLVGLPPEDGCRLIPVDAPTLAPFVPDWCTSLTTAIRRRPELIQIRMDIQANQLAVLREKDFLLPDLRFISSYNINAIGSHLDGSDPDSALRNLAENEFNDWLMGFRMTMPIGYRDQHAEVRKEQLRLAQRMAWLRDNELKVAFSLQRAYRSMFQSYEEIRAQRARRVEAAIQLDLEYKGFLAGRSPIDVLLDAQRNWADAIRDEHFAICDYNIALADFERQKGTILEHDNVSILEGPLPQCAQVRASAHIRERARSIMLKEPLDGVPDVIEMEGHDGEKVVIPDASTVMPGVSVPAILEPAKPLTPLPERLPLPQEKSMPKSLRELRDQPLDLSTLPGHGERDSEIKPAVGEVSNAPLRPMSPPAPAASASTKKPLATPYAPTLDEAPPASPVLDLIPVEPRVKPASTPVGRPSSSTGGAGPARASVRWETRPDPLGTPE